MDTTAADMPQRRTFSGRWVAIAAGVVALVAFFFPWINYQDRAYSGFEFAQAMGGVTKGFDVTLYAIPVLAIMVIAFALVSMLNDNEGGAIFNSWAILAAVSGLLISAVFLAEKALSGSRPSKPYAPGSWPVSGRVSTPQSSCLLLPRLVVCSNGVGRRHGSDPPGARRTLCCWPSWRLSLVLSTGSGFRPGSGPKPSAVRSAASCSLACGSSPDLLGGYIVRRPGAAFLAESLAALAEVLLGAAAGPILVVTGIMQAVGCELVFALTRYRSWGWTTLLVAGAVTAIVAIPWNWFRLGYFGLEPAVIVGILVVRIISGGLAGAAAKVIGDLLARTGALNFFPIGRERMEEV